MKDVKFKTPVFHGMNREPAKLNGEEECWVDPTEVCGISSGIDRILKVSDTRNGPKGTAETGKMFSVLHFRGGGSLLVIGKPVKVREILRATLGDTVQEESEAE